MAKNIIELILKGDSKNLETAITRSGKTIDSFGKKAISTFSRVGQTLSTVSDRYLTRFNTLIGGAGMLMAGKAVIDLDARIARLAITSGKAGKEFMGIKKQLFEIADATYTDVGGLVDYINEIVAKTGDFNFAIQTARDAATVSAATGTNMAALGSTAANLMEKMKIPAKDLFKTLDILNIQAKAGAIELSTYAPLMERLTSATARFDLHGEKGVRILGAWVQEVKKATGSAEEATTSIENAVTQMFDPRIIKKMRQYGFNPIDPEATKKAGITTLKNLDDIIKGIIISTKGDEVKLNDIFDIRSARAFSRIASVYRETKGFGEFDTFKKQGGDGAETMKDFGFWTEQTRARLDRFKTSLSKFSNDNFAGPIELLNKALTFFNNHPAIAKGGLYGLMGIAGILGASKVIFGVIDAVGRMTGKGGKGLPGIAGGLAKGGGPVPVYVVNKHLSMLPGGYQFPGGVGEIAKKLPTLSKLGKALPWLGTAGAGLAAGYTVGTVWNDWAAGQLGIKNEGGIGGWLGEKLYDLTHKETSASSKKTEIKNNIPMQITIIGDRPLVTNQGMNTETKITLKRTGL